MAIFTISDLHLSFSCDKKMDVFKGWENYTDRLFANWNRVVGENDTVVIPGDISWGLKIEETIEDFKFLDSLRGKKIILKGNHDLWWPTMTKLNEFLEENKFSTITPLFNSTIVCEDMAICGSRGWFFEDAGENDKKVILREAGRIEKSISEAEKTGLPIAFFLHYPPAWDNDCCQEIIDVLKKHNIKKVYYGHIHGTGSHKAIKEFEDIKFCLVSADFVDFTPILVTK